jgi:hypothetical protein
VRLARGRRWTVRASIAIAALFAVLAIGAVWASRQLLDADNWADTSTALLEDDSVRTAVSAFLVDEVYATVPVNQELAAALPPRLRPLAGPAAGGLRSFAERTTAEALGRPRVQEAWRTANRVTAQQLIAIAEGSSGAITSSGGAVVLDLRVVLLDVIERLGLPGTLAARVPAGAGRVQIMSGSQVTTLQDTATLLRVLAIALPLLALALLALAVRLARGRRRETLLAAGWALVAAGLIVLAARKLAGNAIVDSLTTTAAVEPAAHAAWSIATGMLRDIAQACLILGIPPIVAAWLAGPSRRATTLRQAMAPWLRERPDVAYGAAGLLLLLIVVWGPIPATRMVLPMLLMALLLALGVAALRRQVEQEFPQGSVASAQTTTSEARRLLLLERLAALHDRGALSDEEFASEKAQLLDGHRTEQAV